MQIEAPSVKSMTAYLAGCAWIGDAKEALTIWPGIAAEVSDMTVQRAGDMEIWGWPIAFAKRVEDPLAAFFEDPTEGRIQGLEDLLLELFTEGPLPSQQQTNRVALELSRQSAAMLSGELAQHRLSTMNRNLAAMDPVEAARFRSERVARVLKALRNALSQALVYRPSVGSTGLIEVLEACPLAFGCSGASRARLRSLEVVGAELGVEVDGVLLDEVRIALEACVQRVRGDGGFLGDRLSALYPNKEVHFAHLPPALCETLLELIQSKVRPRDLTAGGVERSRAKKLLRMKSTTVLFAVFRQLHIQLKRFDLLAGLADRLIRVNVGTQGAVTPYGRLPSSVAWGFLIPRQGPHPVRCSVVLVELSELLAEAAKRGLRDGHSRPLTALWGSWEALAKEAAAVGGVALIRGSQGVGLFERDEEAEAFAASVKRRYRIPIDLSPPGSHESIVLPSVDVKIRTTRGPVFGAWSEKGLHVWGELFAPVSHSAVVQGGPKGFSILTEIGEDEDTMDAQAEETYIEGDVLLNTDSMLEQEDSVGTLDAFFLPSKTEYGRRGNAGQLDLGIDSAALKEILVDYGVIRAPDGRWSFGVLDGQGMLDHHRYKADYTLHEATRAFVLDKYREGFAPRSDSRESLIEAADFVRLTPELLEDVMGGMISTEPGE